MNLLEPTNLEQELIIELCKRVHKIGDKTAAHIASYLDTIDEFMLSKKEDLLAITNKRGKSLINSTQAETIISIRDKYLPSTVTDIRKMWITYLIRDFVERAVKEIQDTNIEKMLINPFLIRAFNFTDYREVVTFCFYQKVTRSIVTSWGFVVEKMLQVSGGIPLNKKSEDKGFDLYVFRDKKQYFLQIKSSPNTMDYDQVQNLNNNIAKLQMLRNKIGMLGVTYGIKNNHLSSIMQGVTGYPDNVLVGHELWDFIADEKGYAAKVLEWASAGVAITTNFSDLLDETRFRLIEDWKNKYGEGQEGIETVLRRYLSLDAGDESELITEL